MNQNEFIKELEKINIKITDEQLNLFSKYYDLLVEWNNNINLTAITKKEDVYLKHFYDSLTIIKVIDLTKINNLCDIGTGAGFPGIVLKIMFPELEITLVDSLNKRVVFLNEVINQLNLKKINAIHSRAEDFAKLNREKFDIVTARAVANLNTLLEICIPSVKVNGYFIPLKSSVEEEIKNSQNALKILNCEIETLKEFLLPIEGSKRTILKIKKIKKTELKYPRMFNEIKKKGL